MLGKEIEPISPTPINPDTPDTDEFSIPSYSTKIDGLEFVGWNWSDDNIYMSAEEGRKLVVGAQYDILYDDSVIFDVVSDKSDEGSSNIEIIASCSDSSTITVYWGGDGDSSVNETANLDGYVFSKNIESFPTSEDGEEPYYRITIYLTEDTDVRIKSMTGCHCKRMIYNSGDINPSESYIQRLNLFELCEDFGVEELWVGKGAYTFNSTKDCGLKKLLLLKTFVDYLPIINSEHFSQLNAVVIPKFDTDIEDSSITVRSLPGIRYISIPDDASVFSPGAFRNNEIIERFSVSPRVVDIDSCTFYGDIRLRNISLNYIESIGAEAFKGVMRLNDIKLEEIIEVGESAFEGVQIKKVDIGEGIERIDSSAFTGAENVIIRPEGVPIIGVSAFKDDVVIEVPYRSQQDYKDVLDVAISGNYELYPIPDTVPGMFSNFELLDRQLSFDDNYDKYVIDLLQVYPNNSYGSKSGNVTGSTYFDFISLGKKFDSSGESFNTYNDYIDNKGTLVSYLKCDDWRIPTESECESIIGLEQYPRIGSTVNGNAGSRYALIQLVNYTICGTSTPNGLLIFPDDKTISGKSLSGINNSVQTTGVTIDELREYIDQKCEFLPALGYVNASGAFTGGGTIGAYWTCNESDDNYGEYIIFDANSVLIGNSFRKTCKLPVRLIRNETTISNGEPNGR